MLKEKVLKDYEQAVMDLLYDDSYNDIGKLNIAAWLGEKARFMLADIRQLQTQRNRLLMACKDMMAQIESERMRMILRPTVPIGFAASCANMASAISKVESEMEKDDGQEKD